MGEVVERSGMLLPDPAVALSRLLDVPCPDFEAGEGLPLLWHWVYLLDRPAQVDLGRDGHPVRGTIPAPPSPDQRRMWAGGRVESLAPLLVGDQAIRRTSVISIEHKTGRTGALTFVRVGHEITQNGQLAVRERQDLVYRKLSDEGPFFPSNSESTSEVPPGPEERGIAISPTLLFRFSALTYNGHRIHYDRDYARSVEGYPGLVTHGPLQGLAMAEAARSRGLQRPFGSKFEYRLISPLFDHQGMIVAAQSDGTTAVRDRLGRTTAMGTATP